MVDLKYFKRIIDKHDDLLTQIEQKKMVNLASIEEQIQRNIVLLNKYDQFVSSIRKRKVLIERENSLVRTIQTDEAFIQLDLYDNGTIDHDSISVFDNNIQVVKNGGLSYTPITLKIKMSKEDPRHEIIMVAENMGEIPPNTALMVITAGKKWYEVFLTSTEEKNAKVIIEYKPKQ